MKQLVTYQHRSQLAARLAERGLSFSDLAAYLVESEQTTRRKASGEREWRPGQYAAVLRFLNQTKPCHYWEVWPHWGQPRQLDYQPTSST